MTEIDTSDLGFDRYLPKRRRAALANRGSLVGQPA